MAAHRIRTANNINVIPRCKSEGTLIELSSGVSEANLSDVKGFSHVSVFFSTLHRVTRTC